MNTNNYKGLFEYFQETLIENVPTLALDGATLHTDVLGSKIVNNSENMVTAYANFGNASTNFLTSDYHEALLSVVLTLSLSNINKEKYTLLWEEFLQNNESYDIRAKVIFDKVLKVANKNRAKLIDQAIWKGVKAGSLVANVTPINQSFDGFFKQADTLGATHTTGAVTSANVIATINNMLLSLPSKINRQEPIYVYVSSKIMRFYRIAIANKYVTNAGFFERFITKNPNKSQFENLIQPVINSPKGNQVIMIENPVFDEDDIFIAQKENLHIGTNKKPHGEFFANVRESHDNNSFVELIIYSNLGVVIFKPENIAYHTLN